MAGKLLILALFCVAASHVYGSRSLTQTLGEVAPALAEVGAPDADDALDAEAPDAGAPDFAPAPSVVINGVDGYSCVTPGVTGYLFQPDPCNFGEFAGSLTYCDLTTEDQGVVGIRELSEVECVTTNSCPTGHFCSQQTEFNRTCTPVADVLCFAGALPPGLAPGPAPGADGAAEEAAEEALDGSELAPALGTLGSAAEVPPIGL